jgi:hypothetical protein
MTRVSVIPACALLLLALAGCVVSPMIPAWSGAPQEQLTLTRESGFIVPATVNGQPVRLRVETGYAGVVLNPDVAARVRLRESIFENDIMLGPVRVQGHTGVAPLGIGGQSDSRRIVWFDSDITAGADGVINIADLPYASVTLQLGAPRPGEVETSLATIPSPFWNLTHRIQAGREEIIVRFLLEAQDTLLTAAAGAHLAPLHGGSWSGDPFAHTIRFGISRPVRPMAFSRPLLIGNLAIDRALVRTSDFRGNFALPTDPAADPGEVVVTGQGRRTRAQFTAILGADTLSRCSSLTYVGVARTLTLRCGNPAR